MWNAKHDVCSMECHGNLCRCGICLWISIGCVNKLGGQTSTSGTAICHRRGRSDERLMAGSTLSADGTSGTATLPPANRGGTVLNSSRGGTTLSLAPITMTSMSTRRETEHELKVHTRKSREWDWLRATTASI